MLFRNENGNDLETFALEEGTDKSKRKHFYTKWYNFHFKSVRHEKINFLEIGVDRGRSLRTWGRYFTNANIYGVDIKTEDITEDIFEKFTIFIGDQGDKNFLKEVNSKIPGGLDIVIDDGSHMSRHQVESFVTLFPLMNSGGVYVIEDLFLSYNKDFQKKTKWTIMQFLTDRIDDVNYSGKYKWCDYDMVKAKEKTQEKVRDRRTKKGTTKVSLNKYENMIEAMHFYSGMCFIFKR